jgi:hypothetical protein
MKHQVILCSQSLCALCSRGKGLSEHRKINLSFLILLAFILSGATVSTAQTTIGSLHDPAKGALLDLKSQLPGTDNVTSKTGGLLLPRVNLNSPNDFSLLPNPTDDQKKDHIGLMVYNLKADEELDKGIYQWNGEMWRKLNNTTKTENVIVRKAIYTASSPDPQKILSIGMFEFRVEKKANNLIYPQFRLRAGVTSQSIYWHINGFWDIDPSKEASGKSESGYGFLLRSQNVNSTTWTDCQGTIEESGRSEVWLTDLANNYMYQIQFAIINGSTNTYVIIAKQY